jgi:hypothetical protein
MRKFGRIFVNQILTSLGGLFQKNNPWQQTKKLFSSTIWNYLDYQDGKYYHCNYTLSGR